MHASALAIIHVRYVLSPVDALDHPGADAGAAETLAPGREVVLELVDLLADVLIVGALVVDELDERLGIFL